MAYIFGVDLGGTAMKFGCFDADGTLIGKWQIPTCAQGDKILFQISQALLSYLKQNNIPRTQVIGVGIGVPGPVLPDGTVNRCVNLGWDVFNIESELSALCGFPVKAANDATLAALGESRRRGCDALVLMTLGTGIGGGIVINAKPLIGAGGAAGEFGHIVLEQGGYACSCGNFGCAEQYCAAPAIVRLAKEHLQRSAVPSILRQIKDFDCKAVFDAARDCDALAQAVIAQVCDKLAQLIAAICNAIDPALFVIGGGVSQAGQVLLDGIAHNLTKYLFHACRTQLALALTGNDAGIYGCYHLISELLSSE